MLLVYLKITHNTCKYLHLVNTGTRSNTDTCTQTRKHAYVFTLTQTDTRTRHTTSWQLIWHSWMNLPWRRPVQSTSSEHDDCRPGLTFIFTQNFWRPHDKSLSLSNVVIDLSSGPNVIFVFFCDVSMGLSYFSTNKSYENNVFLLQVTVSRYSNWDITLSVLSSPMHLLFLLYLFVIAPSFIMDHNHTSKSVNLFKISKDREAHILVLNSISRFVCNMGYFNLELVKITLKFRYVAMSVKVWAEDQKRSWRKWL